MLETMPELNKRFSHAGEQLTNVRVLQVQSQKSTQTGEGTRTHTVRYRMATRTRPHLRISRECTPAPARTDPRQEFFRQYILGLNTHNLSDSLSRAGLNKLKYNRYDEGSSKTCDMGNGRAQSEWTGSFHFSAKHTQHNCLCIQLVHHTRKGPPYLTLTLEKYTLSTPTLLRSGVRRQLFRTTCVSMNGTVYPTLLRR